MECYVCGTLRPEGANYCPGCGRYCADDPNVPKKAVLPAEALVIEDPVPMDESIELDAPIPLDQTVPEDTSPAEDAPAAQEPPAAESALPENAEPVPQPEPAPGKGKKRRQVLIPTLIMTGLFLVGSVCWFLFPYNAPQPDDPGASTEQTAGATEPGTKKPTLPQEQDEPSGAEPAETHAPTDERCFRIEGGVVSFLPERYDGGPVLVIPAQIDGQTVTAIADYGFAGLEGVTTLVLPETLESIGAHAFENCRKLRGVYIPDSVSSIGERAFSGCIDMESVSIPVGTTSIGADAFDGCASLMYIFYEGGYEAWMALYNEYITPFTYACCADGDYYHGAYTP